MSRTSHDSLAGQILADVELGDGDLVRLADLHIKLGAQLGDIAQKLIDGTAAGRDAAGSTSAEPIGGLRSALVDWMASGLAGPHGEHFGERRTSLGHWHAAAGLSQRHAIRAVHVVRSEYHERIEQLYEPVEGWLVAKSVNKLLDVELASMVDDLDSDAELAAREHGAQSERVAAMQTLTTGLAHEVRNPLNSASLQLELLERRLRRMAADPKLIEPVEQVSHELERLSRLLNDFLAFARPAPLTLADHDVSGIVRDVLAVQRPFAAARGAELRQAGIHSLRARLDAEKLRLICQNLVRNGLEAVAPGGHVVVTVDGDEERVRLVVEDDGPGISEDAQRRLYEPFFTTKEGGTGLGLSIVHGMVATHGGTIAFDSSPRGTRFDVSLPRRPWLQRPIA